MGVTAGGQKTAAGQPRARTTVRALGSKTCREVVARGSLDAEVLCDRGDEEAGAWLLAPTVFITKSLIVPLCLRQMWFPLFSGWLSMGWFSLSSLIPSTFQMAKPWMKWF